MSSAASGHARTPGTKRSSCQHFVRDPPCATPCNRAAPAAHSPRQACTAGGRHRGSRARGRHARRAAVRPAAGPHLRHQQRRLRRLGPRPLGGRRRIHDRRHRPVRVVGVWERGRQLHVQRLGALPPQRPPHERWTAGPRLLVLSTAGRAGSACHKVSARRSRLRGASQGGGGAGATQRSKGAPTRLPSICIAMAGAAQALASGPDEARTRHLQSSPGVGRPSAWHPSGLAKAGRALDGQQNKDYRAGSGVADVSANCSAPQVAAVTESSLLLMHPLETGFGIRRPSHLRQQRNRPDSPDGSCSARTGRRCEPCAPGAILLYLLPVLHDEGSCSRLPAQACMPLHATASAATPAALERRREVRRSPRCARA